MLRWALIFFVLALVSAIFGFTRFAAGAAPTARISFYITGIGFLVFLAAGVKTEKQNPPKL